MPKNASIFRIFVSSADDVSEERNIVEEAIAELNHGICRAKNCRLEVVRWEADVYPGVGQHSPQEVINEQISDNYDIFVGILWKRFGTPTAGYQSGTEMEFHQALQRYRSGSQAVRILMYFRRGETPIDDLDLEQLQKVNQFRKKISEEGVLWKDYSSEGEFGSVCRIHLSQVLNDYGVGWGVPVAPETIASNEKLDEDSTDAIEKGLLDLIDESLQSNENVISILGRLTQESSALNESLTEHTGRLSALMTVESEPRKLASRAKKIIDSAAGSLEEMADSLGHVIPLFAKNFDIWLATATESAQIASSMGSVDSAQLSSLLAQMTSFEGSLQYGRDGLGEFATSIKRLPKMTTRLNTAKRKLGIELGAFDRELERSIQTVSAVRATLQAIVK